MPLISKVAAIALVVAAAVLAVGCTDNSEGTPASTPTPIPSTSESPTDPTGIITADKGTMPTGATFALVRGAEAGALILDPASFLSGAEALDAAREDGGVGADEDLPNDFYIHNLERESLIVAVADGASFTLIGFDANGGLVDVEADFATLEALLSGGDSTAYYGFVATDLPMTVDIEDGVIAGGRQQYLP